MLKDSKPRLPKNEEKSQKIRKLFFSILTGLFILATIFILWKAFKAPATTESTEATKNTEPVKAETPKDENNTSGNKNTTNTDAVSSGQKYTVASGDTLYTIGQKFNIDWKEIADANKLSEPYDLKVGQELIIPQASQTETP